MSPVTRTRVSCASGVGSGPSRGNSSTVSTSQSGQTITSQPYSRSHFGHTMMALASGSRARSVERTEVLRRGDREDAAEELLAHARRLPRPPFHRLDAHRDIVAGG